MAKGDRKEVKLTGTIFGISTRAVVYVVLALIMLRCVTWAYSFGHNLFYTPAVEDEPGQNIEVQIPDEASVQEVAGQLKSQGLIRDRVSFVMQAKFFKVSIKPGKYELNTSQTSREILDILQKGNK